MESKITTSAELGEEEDDGEEWIAYIVNAYLCFRDFDSNELKENSLLTNSNLKSKDGKSSNSKSIPSAHKLTSHHKSLKYPSSIQMSD